MAENLDSPSFGNFSIENFSMICFLLKPLQAVLTRFRRLLKRLHPPKLLKHLMFQKEKRLSLKRMVRN